MNATRRLPFRSWLGLAIMLISEVGMLLQVEPFYSWHTPTAWTGYILFVDGVVWKRRGESWLSNAPREFIFLATMSVPLWVVFELYNKYALHNWYYVGLPDSLPLRYFGYVWSFATIWPAIFETADLLATFRTSRSTDRYLVPARRETQAVIRWPSIAAGAAMLIIPLVFPSPYLAAPIWLGFIFLLDPINERAGDESIVGDIGRHRPDRLGNLLAAGLICGLIWEFWNYWAGTKWMYNVPVPPKVKLFEMPLAGFGGFPPFAVECFVMYVAVRRWLWHGARRPISV